MTRGQFSSLGEITTYPKMRPLCLAMSWENMSIRMGRPWVPLRGRWQTSPYIMLQAGPPAAVAGARCVKMRNFVAFFKIHLDQKILTHEKIM